MRREKQNSGVIAAGLALFSMFFGAGDLLWPLILGGNCGNQNLWGLIGLLISGVSLPLLGLLSMMLFQGNYREFFGQVGVKVGFVLIFLIQAILGPLGSIPRLITLSYATLKPYMPASISLFIFSLLSCVLVFLFTLKKRRIIDILGLILCPILLISLGSILVMGLINPPSPENIGLTKSQAFFSGLNVGYNTLDLIASFIFAPLVLAHFQTERADSIEAKKRIFKKMAKSCLIAAFLLSIMYIGLTFVSSFYTPFLPEHANEERLAVISLYLLGSKGALVSCIAVALSCLTTAIPISVISAEFIHQDLMKKRSNIILPVLISLSISALMANVGFMGIANFLSPILQILCPGLILLSVLNIFHKLYEMRMRRLPILAAFALSTIGYFIH